MRTTPTKPTTKASAASKSVKTTIELDAELVAKIRASLRAIGGRQTLEGMIETEFEQLLESDSGVFEGLIENERRRSEMEAKLERIRQGDKRLVRPEPMPRNTAVFGRNLGRLDAIAAGLNTTRNTFVNSLIEHALDDIEAGKLIIQVG